MASPHTVDFAVVQAKRAVLDAMQLDQNNKNKEAYVQYLHCIQYIIHAVLQDVQTHDFVAVPNTKKCVKLGLQCMERVSELTNNMPGMSSIPSPLSPPYNMVTTSYGPASLPPSGPSSLPPSSLPPSVPSSLPPSGPSSLPPSVPSSLPPSGPSSLPPSGPSSLPPSRSVRSYSQPTSLPIMPEQSQDPAIGPLSLSHNLPEFKPVGHTEPDAGIRRRMQGLTPLEVAHLQNQKLRVAYQNRVAQMSRKNYNTTAMALTLQRKLAENMAIAKAQQEALNKKLHERKLRLEHEAALRFASNTGMSEDEQLRRHMYTKILEFEHDLKWLMPWRQKLKQKPDDTRLIQDLIRVILKTPDHPLTQMICKQQMAIFKRLQPIVTKYIRDLDHVTVPYTCKHLTPSVSSTAEDSVSTDSGTFMGNHSLDSTRSSQADSTSTTSLESGVGSGPELTPSNTDGDIAAATETIKDDIRQAINANKKLVKQLTLENEQIKAGLCLDVTKIPDIETQLSFPGDETDHEDPSQDEEDESSEQDKQLSSDGACGSVEQSEDVVGSPEIMDESVIRVKQLQSLLKSVTMEIRDALERNLTMFIVAYEQLDSSEGREMCMSCLEEPFFKPLWPYLITLFRLVNQSQEERVAMVMTHYRNVGAAELGVQERYIPGEGVPLVHDYPYHPAVGELRRLTIQVSPLSKLELIVRVCRLICQCVDEYSTKSSSNVGADDLLPIMSYVVVRSEMPQLVSECCAMEEFIHESYLMGEEGYCLTSMMTALLYVSQLQARKT